MNIDIKKIILAAWLGGSVIGVLANPYQREDRREAQRAGQQQQQEYGYQRNDRRNEQYAEDPRKNGRMSPEDRRALRRQINEAGQDIYSRKPQR